MGLFKTRQDKEIAKKLLLRKTMSNLNKYIAGLDSQKNKYIESAKKAKKIGSESQYNLSISGLKTAIAQQRRAEEMLLNFELTSQMKDLTSMTSSFLKGMSTLSKDMAKITSNNDFVKVQQQFEKAMLGVEDTSEKLDTFLENTDASFEGIATKDGQDIDDKMIEKVINSDLQNEEDELDAELNSKIEEIKKSISADTKE